MKPQDFQSINNRLAQILTESADVSMSDLSQDYQKVSRQLRLLVAKLERATMFENPIVADTIQQIYGLIDQNEKNYQRLAQEINKNPGTKQTLWSKVRNSLPETRY